MLPPWANKVGRVGNRMRPVAGRYTSPYDRYFENKVYKERYGRDGLEVIKDWAKSKAPLDPRTDAQLPAWAIDVLTLSRIPFRGRIAIVLAHAQDIYSFGKERLDSKWTS